MRKEIPLHRIVSILDGHHCPRMGIVQQPSVDFQISQSIWAGLQAPLDLGNDLRGKQRLFEIDFLCHYDAGFALRQPLVPRSARLAEGDQGVFEDAVAGKMSLHEKVNDFEGKSVIRSQFAVGCTDDHDAAASGNTLELGHRFVFLAVFQDMLQHFAGNGHIEEIILKILEAGDSLLTEPGYGPEAFPGKIKGMPGHIGAPDSRSPALRQDCTAMPTTAADIGNLGARNKLGSKVIKLLVILIVPYLIGCRLPLASESVEDHIIRINTDEVFAVILAAQTSPQMSKCIPDTSQDLFHGSLPLLSLPD